MYSCSRATVGYLPATGGRSGAVLPMACTPGFSSTETVITMGCAAPFRTASFCSANLLIYQQHLLHFGQEAGIAALQVVRYLVRMQGLCIEDALHRGFSRSRQGRIAG